MSIKSRLYGRYFRWRRQSPAFWARLGSFSDWLAGQRRPAPPPLLLLSLPRSGSSWVGATLGQAANALYLREPLTQSHLAAGGGSATPAVDPAALPAGYAAAAAAAFAGLPRFATHVTPFAEQWTLTGRSRRRLVVKEVNPHAAAWLLADYQPRLIFLTRHPAAIALSYRRQGWWGDQPDVWTRIGASFAAALAAARPALDAYPDCHVVSYEALCWEPAAAFRHLFDFAHLDWDQTIVDLVERQSRDSRQKAASWRREIKPAELDELAAVMRPYDLPWYRDDADWQL